ncbi:MAG: hypothetical protein AAF366_15195, partial [Pseudomonadota bacterium]
MSDTILTSSGVALTLRDGVLIDRSTPVSAPGLPDDAAQLTTYDPVTGFETGQSFVIDGVPGPVQSPLALVATSETITDPGGASWSKKIEHRDAQGNLIVEDTFGDDGINVRARFFGETPWQIRQVDTEDASPGSTRPSSLTRWATCRPCSGWTTIWSRRW